MLSVKLVFRNTQEMVTGTVFFPQRNKLCVQQDIATLPQRCHECCWAFAFVVFAFVISTCLCRVEVGPEMSRVFLGNLPSDCRVEDIEDFFRDFGKVMLSLEHNRGLDPMSCRSGMCS